MALKQRWKIVAATLDKKRVSIVAVAIGVIVAVVSLLLGAAGVATYGAFKGWARGELHSLTAIQVDQAATALAPALWNFDEPQIGQIAESFMKDRRVYAIIVKNGDSSGGTLTMARDSLWRPVRVKRLDETSGFSDQGHAVVYRGKYVGSVKLFVSPVFLEKKLGEIRWIMVLVIILVAALLTFALYVLLWRIVIRPVRILDRYARAVRLGERESTRAVTDSFFGELDTLRSSVTEMITQLNVRAAKLHEQACSLSESEAFRRRIFDSSRVPIVIMDAMTNLYIDCNMAAAEIYRYPSREEVIGKSPLDFSASTQYDEMLSSDKARCYVATALAEGSVVFEWLHRRPNGELWDAEVHLVSFKSGARQLLQFTLKDITEWKKAEEYRHLFSATLDVASDGVYWMDTEGKFVYVNESGCRNLGYGREELLSLHVGDIAPAVTEEKWKQILNLVRSHRNYMSESIHRRKDGSTFPV